MNVDRPELERREHEFPYELWEKPDPVHHAAGAVDPIPRFAAVALFRGADIDLVWRDLAYVALIGTAFFAIAIAHFRASMAGTR